MIVNGREILKDARENGYAIGAFNASDHGTAEMILTAAEELNVPVMIQISDFASPLAPKRVQMTQKECDYYMMYLRNRAEASPVPVMIHLDHCKTFDGCIRAIRAGATSVMIDASMKSMEENIELTNKVIEAAHGCDVLVEAEIGHVAKNTDEVKDQYTTVEEAKHFYEATGVDLLAVAIGTAHGVYTTKPVLQYDRISQLKEAIPAPLVMHGASGLAPEEYQKCVRRGICKINFNTYLQTAAAQSLREQLAVADNTARFRTLVDEAKKVGTAYVKEHIGYFGTKPYTR
ncbi:class II fructose-bisphosphate aldolase [Intestinimonas massiliensis (ex Afouda et al. 2020)]|uniref:class II fructose-bisphosphate aldolase n=1 Tax=Intestinimonas massiliensis (ex Afouda et al. 2020) TaxID=1673721 RepID=UPI00103147AE|nr:class II fructose-bisphosphate aldolase [Intestinimonas massiliensis (ex Afouda et al. 2020)]